MSYATPSPSAYGAPAAAAPAAYGVQARPVYQAPRRRPREPKNPGTAAVLEFLPGFLLSTYGVGLLYAGDTGLGLGVMFGYWAVTIVNFFLCFVIVGFVTWPVCAILMAMIMPMVASARTKVLNARAAAAQGA